MYVPQSMKRNFKEISYLETKSKGMKENLNPNMNILRHSVDQIKKNQQNRFMDNFKPHEQIKKRDCK